ncbi:MAG TPA: glycosyltransferase [Gaiellaceae bacterium]|nr:glycosyltransferase [Gaiellaceae bacterium]
MTASIVHVIQSLSRGGGGRALLSVADHGSTIVSLTAPDPLMRARAEAAGVAVIDAAGAPETMRAADVVLVHFWNTPELWEFLRGGLPPVRLAVWTHVAGDSPPQIVTPELLELADATVATTARTGLDQTIPPAPDPDRLAGAEPQPHDGFTVGYIGTVDFVKLHPRFFELSAAVAVPSIRFLVCGSGTAVGTIARHADPRFELLGYVEDIASVLAQLDVFGYPLAPGNYSASDLALQEAMSAGVPPVVLANGAAASLVEHGVNGLVAADEAGYTAAIEHLHANPEERLRLGRNARERARRTPQDVADGWSTIVEDLLEQPKRERPARPIGGAGAFVASLGEAAPEFRASLDATDDESALEPEAAIASAPAVLVSATGGGVLHYRRHYPDDPHLRLWSGLVLDAAGHHALAVAELRRACELGLDTPRSRAYLARAAEAIGARGIVAPG